MKVWIDLRIAKLNLTFIIKIHWKKCRIIEEMTRIISRLLLAPSCCAKPFPGCLCKMFGTAPFYLLSDGADSATAGAHFEKQ